MAQPGERTQVQRSSSVGNVKPEMFDETLDKTHAEGKKISVLNLTFRYSTLYEESPVVLDDIVLQLEAGSRCLLLGSNGAGKSTLLNVMGGKHIHPPGAVMVCGQPAFHNTHPGIISITGNWTRTAHYEGHSVAYAKDISVQQMIDMVAESEKCPARIAKIIEVLDIDLEWRMHVVSDGQRRRVQLLMGLMRNWEVLLLDEVTVDLDVVARANLLNYLKEETEERGATIVYATHIFDGLDRWGTHLARLQAGNLLQYGPVSEFTELQARLEGGSMSPLLKTVTAWLREEKERERIERAQKQNEDSGVDLKLNNFTEGDQVFAKNRMHNMTMC